MAAAPIRSRRTAHTRIVLLCGKCARKLDGGYGPKGKDTLKDALRQALRDGGRRDVRIVETRCLGVCPKKATTMIVGDRPDEVLVVARGTAGAEVLSAIA